MPRETIKKKLFILVKSKGFFWIRYKTSGFGIIGKDTTINGTTFGNHITLTFKIGKWMFGALKPINKYKP
jgi:hypothetical protein